MYKDGSGEVKDGNGNVITAEKKFTPEKPDGTVDIEFTFDASITAGRKIVVFEDVYYKEVRVATHSDLKDENQTLDTSLLLHVKLIKSDFDNHEYVLKNAEISIYVDEKCTQLAKDINGNDCVGMTNEQGIVEFIICTYDKDQVFYAKETKAPFGYKICEDIIPIHASAYYGNVNTTTTFTETDAHRESAGMAAINLKMFDKIIIIPPKTGDNLPILPIMILSLLGLLCVGAFFATKRKKVVADVDDSTDTVEEMDEEEVMDAVTGMMTEEIDGDSHNDSGF
jgi:LPXTG-motif cell wall-anchored protein